jgi:putative nucleotidyltransferase with HDIG domain
MTANIMKLVNSAFFGSRRPITTADRAVAYLGMDTLAALVLGHGVFEGTVATGIPGFNLEHLWQHSVQTGTAARAIALSEKFSAAKADEAFLAGVLHDIGRVVFATKAAALPNDTAAAAQLVVQMEAHHAEVGAYLLGLWGFPHSIVEAVAFHHSPSKAAGDGLSLPKLIHIADRLVDQGNTQCSGPFEFGLESGLLDNIDLADRWPKWLAALDSSDFARTAA